MDPFLTTYKKDYIPKFAIRLSYRRTTNEFRDPLGESFKNYLQLSSNQDVPIPPTEDADMYLNKQNEIRPKLAKIYFQDCLNNKIMEKTFIYNGRSQYQIEYCDLEKDQAYKEELRKKMMFRLPDDTYIPLTTHQYYLRNPVLINSRALQRVKQNRVPNNLGTDAKIREILKITTGKSDYGGRVGKLGELIMNQQLHGKITHPEFYE